jgi:hypothetical protein
LAVLKAAEADPTLIDKKITYAIHPQKKMKPHYFRGDSILEGKTYTVRELLHYCIAHSDNHATHALETNVDLSQVLHIFEGVGLPRPDFYNSVSGHDPAAASNSTNRVSYF